MNDRNAVIEALMAAKNWNPIDINDQTGESLAMFGMKNPDGSYQGHGQAPNKMQIEMQRQQNIRNLQNIFGDPLIGLLERDSY